MKRVVIVGLALAGAWAFGLPADARSIPVHRDYVQPLVFYDHLGARAEVTDDGAPDQVALRHLRDTKTQEALFGRETFFEMVSEPGASPFGRPAPPPVGAGGLMGGEEGPRRRQAEESSRNWLVQSLTLPSLGQTATNAAFLAMSTAGEATGWGWLADEITQKAELLSQESPAKEDHAEEVEAIRQRLSTAREASREADARPQTGLAAPAAERGTDARPVADPLGARPAPAAPSAARQPAGIADLSQTRRQLTDLSPDSRTERPNLRLLGERVESPRAAESAPAERPAGGGWAGIAPAPTGSGMEWSASQPVAPVTAPMGGGFQDRANWHAGWATPGAGTAGGSGMASGAAPLFGDRTPPAPRERTTPRAPTPVTATHGWH